MSKPDLMARLGSVPKDGTGRPEDLLRGGEHYVSEYRIEMIPLDKIRESDFNQEIYSKDSEESIRRLQESIKYEGLQQPLIVIRSSGGGTYTILSGHRRFQAISSAISADDAKMTARFRNGIPCRVLPETTPSYKRKIILIDGNATSREKSAAVIRAEITELYKAYQEAEENGDPMPVSFTEIIQRDYQMGDLQAARYRKSMTLIPELEKIYLSGAFDLRHAADIGAKPKWMQELILEEYQKSGDIDAAYTAASDADQQFRKRFAEYDLDVKEKKAHFVNAKKEKELAQTAGDTEQVEAAVIAVKNAREQYARSRELRQEFQADRPKYVAAVMAGRKPVEKKDDEELPETFTGNETAETGVLQNASFSDTVHQLLEMLKCADVSKSRLSPEQAERTIRDIEDIEMRLSEIKNLLSEKA